MDNRAAARMAGSRHTAFRITASWMNLDHADTVTGRLSRFISGIGPQDIPPSTRRAAVMCVLDLIAASISGFATPAAEAARRFCAIFFPRGPCAIWFDPLRLNPTGAAMANSVAASAMDLDDGHRAAGGHPGASIIPATLAWADVLESSAEEFLLAITIGYEVAVRIAGARDTAKLDTFSTGRWCGYGAAAAAGRLKRAQPQVIGQAMAVSGIHAPIQSASGYSRAGHYTKEGIPWATVTGLAALELAESGFRGPTDILDHPAYFKAEKILAGLGERWAIEEIYFKPYSCCRWIHAALDGLLELMAVHGLAADDIDAVQVQTFSRAVNLQNVVDPSNLEAAQFSIPFCLAVAAIDGSDALLPLTSSLLDRQELVVWAKRVELVVDQEIDSQFPSQAGARIVLISGDNRFEQLIKHPRGDPANPMSRDDLESKLRSVAGATFPEAAVSRILSAVADLADGDLKALRSVLQELRIRAG